MVSDGGESCFFIGGRGGMGGAWGGQGGRRDFVCPLTLPLACFPAPIPPPPFPSGEGGDLRLFYARGSAPCIPGAVPGRHWLRLPSRYPVQGEPEVRRKNDRTAFLLAVPSAKERGDRGRGTSAFEMVLSPGAGRASAAGVLAFFVACLPCHCGTQRGACLLCCPPAFLL